MHALLKQLQRWRFRERLIRLAWGAARLLAVAAVLLAACCAVDYWYDRYAETPAFLRYAMLGVQAVTAFVLAFFFLLKPWASTPPIDDLAARAEEAIPEFDHRLVTAIQLNRKTARTAGMSPSLIAEVTREAGEMAARHRLTSLIDYSRLGWAVMVLMPIVLFWGVFFVFSPAVATALLQRQGLQDVEIPRSIRLTNTTAKLWPAGDEVEIRYEVAGRYQEAARGVVYITPENQPVEEYPLTFRAVQENGHALFAATIPASSVDFTFKARLADARTREVGEVRFVPRPSVKSIEAWAILPDYLGLIPTGPRAGQRYERFQNQGEVQALPGSAVRVAAEFPKAVTKAELVLLERNPGGRGEKEIERRPMTLAADGLTASDTFDLTPQRQGYRVEVEDANGFKNLSPPQRGLILQPDEPPKVSLLDEAFKDPDPNAPDGKGPIDDYKVDGMPIVEGGPFLVGYNARSPLGIGKLWVYYRVNNEATLEDVKREWTILGHKVKFEDQVEKPVWRSLPLSPVTADTKKVGPFVPELGLFQKSGKLGRVELYKLPSPNPESEPAELEAGGRYHFQTAGLTKLLPDGTRAKLSPGDRVEFYVAASDKAPGANRVQGRSESRFKDVVTFGQLEDWNRERDESQSRLKRIEEYQRGVFQLGKQGS